MGNTNPKYTVNNEMPKGRYSEVDSGSSKMTTNIRSTMDTSSHPEFLLSLSKILEMKSKENENCQGIGPKTFQKYISKASQLVGKRLYEFFLIKEGIYSEVGSDPEGILTKEAFCRQAYAVLNCVTDFQQLEYYINVFASDKEEMTYNDFYELISASYEIAQFAHQSGFLPDSLLSAICKAAMHGKERTSRKYIFNWTCQHCPRIVMWMHRYVNHTLTVGYATIPKDLPTEENDNVTPILDNETTTSCAKIHPALIWLLSCSLPSVYTKSTSPQKTPEEPISSLKDPHKFIKQLIIADKPSHWMQLFNSNEHGLSINRFKHHVFDYFGPTLLFVTTDDDSMFAVANDEEWKDSKHFYGGFDALCFQLYPEYKIVEKGAKILYFNISSRGFPTGLQVGPDSQNRALCIDINLELVHYRKIPYKLKSVEVWGCGTTHDKERQIEYKSKVNKDAEQRRKVNRNIEWKDNPDRYLLEMAGTRPNYARFEKDTQNHSSSK